MSSATLPKNARFWVYVNGGPVKLTLRPGESRHWWLSYATDEGYHSEGETWTHCGDCVTREWHNGGRDCDGRLDYSGEDECVLFCLHDVPPVTDHLTPAERLNYSGVKWPNWIACDSRVYDQYAQMSGY